MCLNKKYIFEPHAVYITEYAQVPSVKTLHSRNGVSNFRSIFEILRFDWQYLMHRFVLLRERNAKNNYFSRVGIKPTTVTFTLRLTLHIKYEYSTKTLQKFLLQSHHKRYITFKSLRYI